MRPGAPEEPSHEHSGSLDVVGVLRSAGDLQGPLNIRNPLAEEAIARRGHGNVRDYPSRAAASIAATIFVYPVHRHKLPAMAR